MRRHLTRVSLVCLVIMLRGEHAYSQADQSGLLGGWAGTYTGTGTVVFEEWSTEYADQADIEPFRTIDTTAFEEPVTVVIDTTDDPYSLVFTEVQFEAFTSLLSRCWLKFFS